MRKNKHNYQLKKVNLNMEYWLGNTEKPKNLQVKVLPSLLSSHVENKMKWAL